MDNSHRNLTNLAQMLLVRSICTMKSMGRSEYSVSYEANLEENHYEVYNEIFRWTV